ncbi:hypothetical protein [Actinophytocola sp.]|uniref:MmyB family transcriptional regulator n=1 Tax=Actinophytocola sp. TaxID=1872138 RepID=UPI002ED40533
MRAAPERVLRGHQPYPAIIVDRHGDLVAANEAFAVLTGGVAAFLRTPPVSIPRLLLHPQGMAPNIVNLDEWAWHVLDGLGRQTARNPDPRLTALIDELTEDGGRAHQC